MTQPGAQTMQNGDAFRAFTEELRRFLADKTVIAYYREPLPSETDARLDTAVARFMAADPDQRELLQAALDPAQRSLFGIYGHRAATRAVREAVPGLLLKGLVGAAVANYEIPDSRRVEVGLAVYHHCARKLGLNPADVFGQAADYATPALAAPLAAFGHRGDVALRNFGWQEIHTPEGIVYKFSWR